MCCYSSDKDVKNVSRKFGRVISSHEGKSGNLGKSECGKENHLSVRRRLVCSWS